ncbi:hypothetical protein [Neogemmobacter tilapiae]|uniref:hypothetical protein n=1 Tax=Neogemmobacter tilapiae TaxID=875041 RepID=UPI001679E0DE|nr:hypothetical protein [Gemmobacter tilapiae]
MPVTTFLTLLISVLLAAALTVALAFWGGVAWPWLGILTLTAAFVVRGLHASR